VRSRRAGRLRLVIDGKVLVDDHFSGIGRYTMSLLRAVDEALEDEPTMDVRLAVPVGRTAALARFGFRRIRPLAVPMAYSRMRRRVEQGSMPPMDLLLGRGIYFFPSYVRWPLAASRSVTAVHDLSFEKVPETVDGPNAVFLRREVRSSVRRSDVVTALTSTMADEIAEHYGIGRSRVVVVGCAADGTHYYRRSDREVAAVTSSHGIFGDYLLTVGNIEPRKNQVAVIDAFCRLPRATTDELSLVLVGAGAWNEQVIRARVARALDDGFKVKLLLGCVRDDDLPALYTGARGSVYASIYEGFGMPPLESMACQTPVLCSDRSVLPEVVGDAALLVNPTDPDALTDGLVALVALDGEDRRALVERGLANVDRFDWSESACRLLDVVRDLGAGRR
jgi:glycosyltransferase involved in cell wall biosynthesis